ncbi:unnamed protein product [Spirodela intermedia]|uniref:tRNA-dihydrouridine synthase n=1 Tax=Spirodela intermedia TaxID=51605 RepID=A0A7I8JL83_SPIIN|nr:unnamed protein product [Spirodela intermedia]CAA6670555.1 unnamed protein product [Spirodela intermedia]
MVRAVLLLLRRAVSPALVQASLFSYSVVEEEVWCCRVAPMMDWTDNHFRTLARLLSKHAWLYTEMVVAETIVHQKDNLSNTPLFSKLVEATWRACQKRLHLQTATASMKLTSICWKAMSAISSNCDVPVSVKCRIGVDDHDSYSDLCDFIYTVASSSPTRHFIIHARKALLNGLSPADNRKIPPLKYEYYFALLRDFPGLKFTLNGGITCMNQVNAARKQGANRVMIGRAAYNSPWITLGQVDAAVYGTPHSGLSRRQVLEKYQVYGDAVLGIDGPNKPRIRQIVKPLLNLFHSEPGNGLWKRKADTALRHCSSIQSFLEETLDALPDAVLDSTVATTLPDSTATFANVDGSLVAPFGQKQEHLVACS